MKRWQRFGIVSAAALALVCIPATAAYAFTSQINQDVYYCNDLYQPSQAYYDTITGPVSFKLTYQPSGGGATRMGLRNTAGTQFTQTTEWAVLGTKNFKMPSGSTTIPAQTFYLNVRYVGYCDALPASERRVKGVLTW